jgi:serine/threonine protein phosphatase PrpC
MIQFSANTHPGHRRTSNEDALLADETHGLFVVADGVGGRAAGEVASALTIETFEKAAPMLADLVKGYAESPDWNSRNRVLEALDKVCQNASARVYEEAELNGRRGMTTTLVVALVGGGSAFLAHVGDSRAYLVRDGLIRQLTEDHSMVNDLVRSGQMSWEDARRSRYRNVITRAIGLYPNVQADLMSIEILSGDRILISSDGLSDPVPTNKIEEIACQNDVQTAGRDLVQAALDGGGPDNVTVVLVEPEATPETASARARAQVMQDLFLFQGLPYHARLRVSRICRDVKFVPGQALVRDGDLGDAMYVIAQGEVSVSHNGVELAQLTAGEHFGELGLMEDQTRTATVSGTTHGLALVIDRSDLREFCSREPALGNALLWRLLQTLGQRLRVTNDLATTL